MKKILFVDDEHDFLFLLKKKFGGECEGTFCYTGAEALMQIKNNTFDVVVLDLALFLDGVTLVKLANGRLKDSKVYFLSGFSYDDLEEKLAPVKDRIDGYFNKSDLDLLKKEILA